MGDVIFANFHRERWKRSFFKLTAKPDVPDDLRRALLMLIETMDKVDREEKKAREAVLKLGVKADD